MGIVSVVVQVVGLLATISVGANVFAFRRYRKKFLSPIDNPLDESQEVLATFDIHKPGN